VGRLWAFTKPRRGSERRPQYPRAIFLVLRAAVTVREAAPRPHRDGKCVCLLDEKRRLLPDMAIYVERGRIGSGALFFGCWLHPAHGGRPPGDRPGTEKRDCLLSLEGFTVSVLDKWAKAWNKSSIYARSTPIDGANRPLPHLYPSVYFRE
jgi:hypothetical protein